MINVVDPVGLLIASLVLVVGVMIWAIIDGHMTEKKEREWEEFDSTNHTKEYYDRDRNR